MYWWACGGSQAAKPLVPQAEGDRRPDPDTVSGVVLRGQLTRGAGTYSSVRSRSEAPGAGVPQDPGCGCPARSRVRVSRKIPGAGVPQDPGCGCPAGPRVRVSRRTELRFRSLNIDQP